MPNKLRRYYVITPDTFESLKKTNINENELHALDRAMLQILRDKSTSMGVKWLKYGQELTRHSEKLRKNTTASNNITSKKTVSTSTMTEPIEKHSIETMTEPLETKEIETQVSPTLKRKKVVAKKKKPVKSLTELDEEDEKMYNEEKKYEEEDRNDQSLFDEFGPKQPLRRSKRIKMQKMPTEFDSDLEEASFLQAQEEMKDFDDRNYKKYKPRFRDQRTIEHIPSSSVMTFDLEDVVDLLTDEDVPQKRKTKKQRGGNLFRWDTL